MKGEVMYQMYVAAVMTIPFVVGALTADLPWLRVACVVCAVIAGMGQYMTWRDSVTNE